MNFHNGTIPLSQNLAPRTPIKLCARAKQDRTKRMAVDCNARRHHCSRICGFYGHPQKDCIKPLEAIHKSRFDPAYWFRTGNKIQGALIMIVACQINVRLVPFRFRNLVVPRITSKRRDKVSQFQVQGLSRQKTRHFGTIGFFIRQIMGILLFSLNTISGQQGWIREEIRL